MKLKYIFIIYIFACLNLFTQNINTQALYTKSKESKIEFNVVEYKDGKIKLKASIPEGYYTYLSSYIAKPIKFYAEGFTVTTEYPEGLKKGDDIVLFGEKIFTLATLQPLKEGEYTIFTAYQLCIEKDNICLPLVNDKITFTIPITEISEMSLSKTNAENNLTVTNSEVLPKNASLLDGSNKQNGSLVSKIAGEKNIFITLILIFLAGLASTLLPCTYPLLSVTASLLGGSSSGNTKNKVFSSMLFCLGIMTTYTLLGSIVSIAGSFFHKTIRFGSLGYNPIILSLIVLFFLYFTFSMAGFYEFKTPNFLQNIKSNAYSKKDSSIWYKYIMGLATGIVATPCAAPAVALILEISFLNPAHGILYMATYAFGFSFVLFVFGISLSFLTHLPKSGSWMVYIKFLFSAIMVLVAYYYLQIFYHTLGVEKFIPILSTLTIFAFGALVFLITRKNITLNKKELKIFLIVFLLSLTLGTVYFSIKSVHMHEETPTLIEAIEMSKENGKDIIIDFSAVWCENCYKLKEEVFENEILSKYIKENYIFVEIDIDDEKEISDEFGVKWLPWVIVIDSSKNIKYIKNRFSAFNAKTASELKEDLIKIKAEK